MKYVDNRGETDPAVNLALDEFLVRHGPAGETLLVGYVNAQSVIIGRHQNAAEEVNARFVREHGIPVRRRISGGGAVYHDAGNLNFGIVGAFRRERFNRYDELTRPLLEVLRRLGVPAELGARNEIIAAGQKLSGNAQFASRDRLLAHGTLLVDADLARLSAALAVTGGISSHATRSVRSPVANLNEWLATPMTPAELLDLLAARLLGANAPRHELSEAEWRQVRALAEDKYRTWEWTHGEAPAFQLERSARAVAGEVRVHARVARGGRLEHVEVSGSAAGPLRALGPPLAGVRYARAEVAAALAAAAGGLGISDEVALVLELLHP